ncbi:MAG: DUF4145 domain-containing protein [Acidobacteria bacterium]|nr:DUF4145 domain-containing protein [Acidobacteriota bacterium]
MSHPHPNPTTPEFLGDKLSEILTCPSCGNRTPHDLLRNEGHSYVIPKDILFRGFTWMVKCATCKEIALYRSDWNPQAKGQVEISLLHPQPRQAPGEVPDRIRARFNEAVAVSKTSPSLGGVGLRRTLEELMKDQGAKGKTLAANFRGLADRGYIPGHLAELIDTMKELQLLAAHAEEPDVSPQDIPVLIDFCVAVFEYLYVAPSKVSAVKNRRAILQSKSPSPSALKPAGSPAST